VFGKWQPWLGALDHGLAKFRNLIAARLMGYVVPFHCSGLWCLTLLGGPWAHSK
jgi:hypothetical protein